jgi:triphosphatase
LLNREIELKFTLSDGGAQAVAVAVGLSQTTAQALTAVYFDSPARDLRRGGFAMRVRQTDQDFTQTIKGPSSKAGGGFARGEWETPTKGFAIDRAALHRTPAAKVINGSTVAPAFAVRVSRRSCMVAEGGSQIEISLDEGEAESEGRTSAIREMELELKDGEVADLFVLARRLAQTTPLTLAFTSKSDRGFALVDGAEVRAVALPKLEPGESTADAFRAIAHAALAQVALAGEVLLVSDEAEAVHRLRVGLRRLRSALSTFRRVSGDGRRPGVKAELKWLSGVMDRARDLDVFIAETFEAGRQAVDADGQATLMARLQAARVKAYAAARTALETERYRCLLLETAAWLETGPWLRRLAEDQMGARPIEAFAAKVMDRRLKSILKRGSRLKAMAPAERHQLRIAVKKLRYDIDAFGRLYGHPRRTERFGRRVRDLQTSLGDLNDLAAGGMLAASLARGGQKSNQATAAFAAGEIIGAAGARQAALLAASLGALRGLKRAKPFWR